MDKVNGGDIEALEVGDKVFLVELLLQNAEPYIGPLLQFLGAERKEGGVEATKNKDKKGLKLPKI